MFAIKFITSEQVNTGAERLRAKSRAFCTKAEAAEYIRANLAGWYGFHVEDTEGRDMTYLQFINGIDFRHMDEREREFYLADPDCAAYIHEDEAGAFIIVHDGETWRAQIDESSGDYITTANLWCESPQEAAREIFQAWREVINGAPRDIWQ